MIKKTMIVPALAFAAFPAISFGQTTFAHWDLAYLTHPNAASALTLDCASSGSVTMNGGVNYSTAQAGSEGGSDGYNCFGHWEDSINSSKYVGFNVTFGNNDDVMLSEFNFDVRGYNTLSQNPSKVGIQLFKNGVSVFTDNTLATGLTTAWEDVTASFGSGSNFKSALGSTDTFEVRLYAYDISGTPATRPRIGLDNIRINGHCVPEPSGVGLACLGLIALGARRRR